jgi:hypothetical protein
MATINGTSVGGMTLQIDYSYTQNTIANTTSVTAKLQLVNHYALYATALGGSYISVGGSRTDYSASISYGGSSTTTTVLATKTVTVFHNNDGTGSCNLSGAFVMNGSYRGYSVGTMSVSSTITLPTIPRASGLTVPSSIDTGTTLSGSVTPSNSAFNHKIEFKIGSTVKSTLTLTANQTAPTFTQAIGHDWFPNSTSGTINVVLSTYSGNTLIATTSKNVTANVPASVVPSINEFIAVLAEGGLNGSYVQGKSSTYLTVRASPGEGASISSYFYSGPDVYFHTTFTAITTSVIKSSGNLTYTIQATDSRGRTASKSVQIYVYPYTTPSIGPVDVKRCDANGNLTDDGTYAKYTVNSTYTPIDGKNQRTVTVAYSSNNGASYSNETTLQTATDTANTKTGVYGGSFVTENTYVLRFTIKDVYGATDTITVPLRSASRPINIKSNGKGVAIGGMATKDALEVAMPSYFTQHVDTTSLAVNTDAHITNLHIHGSFTHFGIGGLAKEVSGDWNTACGQKSGFYRGYALNNSPTESWYYVQHIAHGEDYQMQIAQDYFNPENLYIRTCHNYAWNPWRMIMTSEPQTFAVSRYAETPNDKLAQLDARLIELDHMVAECYECQLLGIELPYNVSDIREERQQIKSEIEILQYDRR